MQSSQMRKGIFLALAAVVVLTVASAGCFDNIHFLPNEVQNRGNIITVDDAYVGSSTVVDLLLTPEKYQEELFTALDKYLPVDKPVVDVEVGIGVAMANISKQLKAPKEQVALTSNSYMIPMLKNTILRNYLSVDLVYGKVSYDVPHGYEVPVIVGKNLEANEVMNTETKETIQVPAVTITTLIAESDFSDDKNVTLVVEDDTLLGFIFENEPQIWNNVSRIIAVSSASSQEISQMLNKALKVGYTPAMVGDPGINQVRPLVFERML